MPKTVFKKTLLLCEPCNTNKEFGMPIAVVRCNVGDWKGCSCIHLTAIDPEVINWVRIFGVENV